MIFKLNFLKFKNSFIILLVGTVVIYWNSGNKIINRRMEENVWGYILQNSEKFNQNPER